MATEWNDTNVTISELQNLIMDFVRKRDWEQFHCPKNLSMAIGSEVGELMAHFRWMTSKEEEQAAVKDKNKTEISYEVADIMMLLLEFAKLTEIDIAKVIKEKLDINETRYSVEEFKGKNHKYNQK
ncbi:MAG: nucleotide pyrophosphohydrolase [Sedimentisphaerales bacterium]|nr:nucleotide pyrophosphohydrolase [Sedimentisphaerales bacterium]